MIYRIIINFIYELKTAEMCALTVCMMTEETVNETFRSVDRSGYVMLFSNCAHCTCEGSNLCHS